MRLMKLLACAMTATTLIASTANAQAPAPDQIAQACIGEMVSATQRTVKFIAHRTQHGVHQINFLKSQGAPPPAVFYSARMTVRDIDAAARHGKYVVDHIAGACLAVLNELNAPDPIKHAVGVAHGKTLEAIGMIVQHAVGAIRDALDLNTPQSNSQLDKAI